MVKIHFLYVLCIIIHPMKLSTALRQNLNYKKLSLEVLENDENYVFGLLMYKEKNSNIYVKYTNLKQENLNKICKELNDFDDFFSFSNVYFHIRNQRMIEFQIEQNIIRYKLIIIFLIYNELI